MTKTVFAVVSSLLLSLTLGTAARADEATDFVKAFNASYAGQPLEPQVGAEQYRYVFVGGFLNETLVGYFKDNMRALVKLGVPTQQMHFVPPCSANGVLTNVSELHDKLSALKKLGPQKLVVIAHSKGAVESLAWAHAYAAYVERNVEKLYLVQMALGSGVADYIHEGQPAISHDMPPMHRLFFKATGHTAALLDPVINKGMASLTHTAANAMLAELNNDFGPMPASVSNKIRYIQGAEHPSKMAQAIDCTGWYLYTSFGKDKDNDGLVALKDQRVPGVGQVLGVIEADHADLTAPWPIANAPVELRQALSAGIVANLLGN